MKIEEIIPKNDKWKLSKGLVYVKYLAWIPIIDTRKGYIEIFFDVRLMKYILKLIPKIDTEFYLISPLLSNPVDAKLPEGEIHRINIKNYLSNYANPRFFKEFQKIEFDLVTNLILYCKKFDTMLLIKESYDEVNKEVNHQSWDYLSNKMYHETPEEIRDEFGGLYRQIKLADLLN
jgi:hypothetical protein